MWTIECRHGMVGECGFAWLLVADNNAMIGGVVFK